MNDNNELNDIILDKGGSSSSNKKIILAVATLGVILIIVVMLMNSLTSSGTDNLPQAVLPPQPQITPNNTMQEEPLFEEVNVVQENSSDANLAQIAQKLKQESLQEERIEPKTIITKVKPKKELVPVKSSRIIAQPKTTTKHKQVQKAFLYYVQVGSFSKYAPNKKFLASITKLGYTYEYHTVTIKSKSINKVLVGPFHSQEEAKDARRILRSKIEPGAFLFKLKK